ncbi:hypothetical protein NMY22_g12008 [Coprinellus aureogranulatus]|nr:hypothetical protein NMY22_g12008 [Coprinellus aureogranulatus]
MEFWTSPNSDLNRALRQLGLTAPPGTADRQPDSSAGPTSPRAPASRSLMPFSDYVRGCFTALRNAGLSKTLSRSLFSFDTEGTFIQLDYGPNEMTTSSPCTLQRSYGSIFGVCQTIVPRGVELVLDTTLSCSKRLHPGMQVMLTLDTNQGARRVAVPDIPSTILGTCEPGLEVHVLFLNLYSDTRPTRGLTAEEYRVFWTEVLQPTADGLSGQLNTTLITEANLPHFSGAVQYKARSTGLPWLANLHFVHVVRGQSEPHELDLRQASSNLDSYLARYHLPPRAFLGDGSTGDLWFIEVVLALSVKGGSVVWRTNGHATAYKEVTGLSLPALSAAYQVFPVANLTEASACRIGSELEYDDPAKNRPFVELAVVDEPLHVVRSGEGTSDGISVFDIVNRPEGSISFLNQLSLIHHGRTVDMTAQAKVLVPLGGAHGALISIDENALKLSCYCFESDIICKWKALRCCALDYIVELQRTNALFLSRRLDQSLIVIATVQWLVDTLHGGPFSRYARGIVPLSVETGSGVFSLKSMSIQGVDHFDVPHFDDVQNYSPAGVPDYFLSYGPRLLIESFVLPNGPLPQRTIPLPAPLGRRNFRAARPSFSPFQSHQFYKSPVYPHFDLRPHWDGPDATHDPFLAEYVSYFIESWRIGVTTILESCPLAKADPESAWKKSCGIFKNHDLGVLFRAIQFKHATAEEWAKTFTYFFPYGTTDVSPDPRLLQCEYYIKWIELSNSTALCSTLKRLVRQAIWDSMFKSMYWIPASEGSTIWLSELDGLFTHLGEVGGGIKIFINGRQDPHFQLSAPL